MPICLESRLMNPFGCPYSSYQDCGKNTPAIYFPTNSIKHIDSFKWQTLYPNQLCEIIFPNKVTPQFHQAAHHDLTAQKTKFSITDFFSKCDQIRRKLRIWSHLLKKSLLENFIFRLVSDKMHRKLQFRIEISANQTRGVL